MLALIAALSSTLFAASPADAYVQAIQKAPVRIAVDLKDGFRDLKFGQTCSTTPGFTDQKPVNEMVSWGRPTDALKIGEGALNKIRYLCKDDKLQAVVLSAPTASLNQIALALGTTYGEPSYKEQSFVYWRGQKNVAWLFAKDGQDVLVGLGKYPWADFLVLIASAVGQQAKSAAGDL